MLLFPGPRVAGQLDFACSGRREIADMLWERQSTRHNRADRHDALTILDICACVGLMQGRVVNVDVPAGLEAGVHVRRCWLLLGHVAPIAARLRCQPLEWSIQQSDFGLLCQEAEINRLRSLTVCKRLESRQNGTRADQTKNMRPSVSARPTYARLPNRRCHGATECGRWAG